MPGTIKKPTRTEIAGWDQPTIDLPLAGAALGLGVNASYRSYHEGQFPCRVLKLGRKLRVPTQDLRDVLGISTSDAT